MEFLLYHYINEGLLLMGDNSSEDTRGLLFMDGNQAAGPPVMTDTQL